METGTGEFSKEKLDKYIEFLNEMSKKPPPPLCMYVSTKQYQDMLRKKVLNANPKNNSNSN